MSETNLLAEKTKELAEVRSWLVNYRKEHFPALSFVKVNNPRYHGYGLVIRGDEHPHQVAVKLENGNTWWYEMTTCEVVKDLKQVPAEIRQLKLWWKGIKGRAGWGPRGKLP